MHDVAHLHSRTGSTVDKQLRRPVANAMPPISTRFAPPKARRALPVSENPETTRSREYHRAQFGFEAERRRIATKHRTRKSRAIDKLVKEEHFQSLDAAAQEQAIQQIKADCSEAAAEELAQVEESWKRLTEVVSDEDDSGEADDEGGERTGGLDGEPMEVLRMYGRWLTKQSVQ